MKYSIVVPIYNEEKNIPKMIRKVHAVLRKNKIKYELIFVDDDSQDNSVKIFKKNKNQFSKIIVRTEKPRDLSRSVVYGFNRSKYNNLIVMDGDLQHNPNDLLKLVNTYEKFKCDLVIGSRKLNNYKKVNLNPIRFYFSRLLNFVFNFLFKEKIMDPMSGFFLIKKKIYLESRKSLVLVGYKILIDIILSARKRLYIKEVAINFKERNKGFSKMRPKILMQLIFFLTIKFIKYDR
jgi:dolichol-phosphate mannosyltransferase